MSVRKGDVPSLGALVTGGLGVLVVVVFVGAVAFGRESRTSSGDRVGVAASDGPAGLAVVAARCPEERVQSVQLQVPDGAVLWRIESDKGTIDRVFVVGGEPPPFFATVIDLRSLPPGELEAEVVIDDVVDRQRFDPARLAGDALGVACGDGDLGLVPLLFVIGAAGVVAAYGTMVLRFLRAG